MTGEAGGLAAYVRARRLNAGLTQEALAERAGLTVDTIGALERGLRRRLYPHTAAAIAAALGLGEAERAELAALAGGRKLPAPDRIPEQQDTPVAGTDAPPAPLAAPRSPLPAPLTRLIGRERELALIRERLAGVRLLTLTGMGGAGKTRLATEAARALTDRYPGGVLLIELAALTAPAHVLGAIAAALGAPDTPGQGLLAAVAAFAPSQPLLLVLDNCEHLLPAAATDIAALLAACPLLSILATSREPLRITGEHELFVAPLPVPDRSDVASPRMIEANPAVALFVERATAVKADFAITDDNAPAVAAICARLDGLPLALELAAARVKLFPPAALLSRLDQRLGLLTGGARDRPERHQTLRAAIAWSYDLLSPAEQALFRGLGVFAGGFSLPAVETIGGGGVGGDGVVDTLGALIDKSLLQQDGASAPDDGAAEPRFVMLDSLRAYALEQLAAADDARVWKARHITFFLAVAEWAAASLEETTPTHQLGAARRALNRERDNLRAALQFALDGGQPAEALRLAAALGPWWAPFGNARVGRPWLDQPAGTLCEARSWLEQALALPGDAAPALRARALYCLGRVLVFGADDVNAERLAATTAFEQALALFRALDDRRAMARCHADLGAVLFDQDAFDKAEAHFAEARALGRAAGDRPAEGWALTGLGRLAYSGGAHEVASARFSDALAMQRAAGNQIGAVAALDGLGLVRQSAGDYGGARRTFEEALAVRRTLGPQAGLAVALQRLAILLGTSGDLANAAVLLRESLEIGQQVRNPWDIANALLSLGSVAALSRRPEQAARLFGAGEALLGGRGLSVPEAYRSLYQRSLVGVQQYLGEETFAAALAAGAALPLADAIAEALSVRPEAE